MPQILQIVFSDIESMPDRWDKNIWMDLAKFVSMFTCQIGLGIGLNDEKTKNSECMKVIKYTTSIGSSIVRMFQATSGI